MSHYKMPFNQYKACMRMSQKDFSRWLETFADEIWKKGYTKACSNIPKDAVIIDTSDTVIVDSSEEKLREVLLSVKGVGPTLCEKIIDRIYEVFDGYIKEQEPESEQHEDIWDGGEEDGWL